MFKVIIFLATLFLVGCSSDPEPILSPPPQKSRVIQTPTKPVIYRTDDIKHLRTGEVVKRYSFNRYVDPNDSSVMFQGGGFYRLENSSTWDLSPARPDVSARYGIGERSFPTEKQYYNIEENAKDFLTRRQAHELNQKEQAYLKKNQDLVMRENLLEKTFKASEEMLRSLKIMKTANEKLKHDNAFLKQQVLKLMEEKDKKRGR